MSAPTTPPPQVPFHPRAVWPPRSHPSLQKSAEIFPACTRVHAFTRTSTETPHISVHGCLEATLAGIQLKLLALRRPSLDLKNHSILVLLF